MSIEKYQFNNIIYFKDYETGEYGVEHDKIKPASVFKFYSISKYSIDALTKSYLYASHPIELNDTLDTSKFLLFASEKLDLQLYKNIIGDAQSEQEIMNIYQEDISREHLCSWYISNHYDTSSNLYGIISCTEKENNILMWPHYTQESGFQIKFNTEKLEQSIKGNLTNNQTLVGFYPMNYCERLMPIDVSRFRSMIIPLIYSTNIKSRLWSYEQEWRFIVGKENMGIPYSKMGLSTNDDYVVNAENRFVYYNLDSIEEITVGHHIFNRRNFEVEWLDTQRVRIKPRNIKDNWEYESQCSFLNFIVEKFPSKFYHSGTKYENDQDGFVILVRTKERMSINKNDDGSFTLTRTDDVKVFFE